MRALGLGILIILLIPAAAGARVRTVAPPGNSAVNQYVESVPTAGGGRPTGTIHAGGSAGSGGSGPVAPSTQHALAQQGADGLAAAALARATAPAAGASPSNRASSTGSGGTSGAGTHSIPRAGGAGLHPSTGSAGGGSSGVAAVLKTLTGSSSHGGLGLLLPLILIVTAIGSGVFALRRRRAAT